MLSLERRQRFLKHREFLVRLLEIHFVLGHGVAVVFEEFQFFLMATGSHLSYEIELGTVRFGEEFSDFRSLLVKFFIHHESSLGHFTVKRRALFCEFPSRCRAQFGRFCRGAAANPNAFTNSFVIHRLDVACRDGQHVSGVDCCRVGYVRRSLVGGRKNCVCPGGRIGHNLVGLDAGVGQNSLGVNIRSGYERRRLFLGGS